MKIILLPTDGYSSNSYLLVSSDEALLVDPSGDITDITNALLEHNASLKYIVLTHGHYDHMLSLDEAREKFGASLCVHRFDAIALHDSRRSLFAMVGYPEICFDKADMILEDGDILSLGDEKITVVHTPGHTPGCIMLHVGDDLITGDTLFDMSVGRSDFPCGDHETLLDSIFSVYKRFPRCRIYPGHGPSSTIEKQIKYNPFTKRR